MDQYIRKYGKRLYGLCMTLCADKHEADDLYQDTWVKVLKRFDTYDPSRDFEPWLTRLCVNTYRDRLRRLSRSPFLNFSSNETKEAFLLTATAPEKEDYSDLYAAIDQLPEKLRLTYVVTEKEGRYFLLELVDDMTLDEVQMAGQITDHVLVFEISEEFYLELDALITAKP